MSFIGAFVVFALGLVFIVFFTLSRNLGYRTTGTVAGAIESSRIKKKKNENGEVEERVKKTLYPVYEYTGSDGATKQMPGSEGGTMTLKYSTGQTVNLIVREDERYDDVYDADSYGALYIGLIMSGLGIGLMIWVGSAASAFGVGLTTMLVIGLSRICYIAFQSRDKLQKTIASKSSYNKDFDPADLHPIEYFQSGRKAADSKA